MKVCNVFELKTPTNSEINNILNLFIINKNLNDKLIHFIQGDLRKVQFVEKLNKNKNNHLNEEFLDNILKIKCHNEDSTNITKTLFEKEIPLTDNNISMYENDRTIVSLLWHENIMIILN